MAHNMYYKLVNKSPVPCHMIEFAMWMEQDPTTSGRIIQQDSLHSDVLVSTVFLGLNHGSFELNAVPVLFETMIFGFGDKFQERYCTYDEAVGGHLIALERVTRLLKTFQPVDLVKAYQDEKEKILLNLN